MRGKTMPKTVAIELEIPGDISRFRLPQAVDARLQELLDRQDCGLLLTVPEREEAERLVELAEFLAFLKLRAERAKTALVPSE
jgi:hypothetical protein